MTEIGKLHLSASSYYLLLVSIIVTACSTVRPITDFASFSEQLNHFQKKKEGCGFYPDVSYRSRNQMKEKFDFINYDSDTIHIIQAFDMQSGTLYESLWNKQNRVEYESQGSEVKPGESYFSKRLYTMIEDWDVSGIRKEEKDHGNLNGGLMMLGTRLTLKQGQISNFECISFKEFFDLKKDQ